MTPKPHNFIDGVTLEENFDGRRVHAEFVDDVYPDRTCGQVDRGIIVITSEQREFFVSFTDGSVWDGEFQMDARCPEVCIMAALRDAKEPYLYEQAEDGSLVILS